MFILHCTCSYILRVLTCVSVHACENHARCIILATITIRSVSLYVTAALRLEYYSRGSAGEFDIPPLMRIEYLDPLHPPDPVADIQFLYRSQVDALFSITQLKTHLYISHQEDVCVTLSQYFLAQMMYSLHNFLPFFHS